MLVIDVDRFGSMLSKMGNGVGAVSATNERRLGLIHELIALDGVKPIFTVARGRKPNPPPASVSAPPGVNLIGIP